MDKKSEDETLHSHDSKKELIPMRIESVKEILKKGKLHSMFNFDDTTTENFISSKSNDIRVILDKKYEKLDKILKAFDGKLEYRKSGTTGSMFKGHIKDSGIDYAIKVVFHPKKKDYGNIYDPERPENAELLMIKLLSMFVIRNETPYIILPIATFDCSIEPFISNANEYMAGDERYKDIIKKYEKGYYDDTASILVLEWANRGDFLKFLQKFYKKLQLIHWKVFFFQIISVIAVIQLKFKSWRHNDLKANNILIQRTYNKKEYNKEIPIKKKLHIINNKKFYVDDIGYIIKITDFDFACIPGIIENSKVNSEWTKTINVTSEINRYYDLHFFFNTLIKKGFLPEILSDDIVPKEVKEFIFRVIPKKYREPGRFIHKRGRILVNDEYVLPIDLLNEDEFFSDFR
jgi:serine/threonine protein kinase